jgi:hypothetical protein
MKKILLLIIVSIMSLPLFSQANNSAYNLNTRQIDLAEKRAAFGLTEEEFNNIEGSPYANELFTAGNIYKNDKELFKDVLLRYNIFADEIEIKQNENVSDDSYGALIKEPNTLVKILNNIYIFVPFEGSNEKGHYFSILTEESNFDLYKKTEVSYSAPSYAKTSYDRDRPASFTQKSIYYMVSKDGKFYELPNSKSKIIKVMNKRKDQVKAYIKTANLDFKKEIDLIKLVKYYNSLL